MPWEASDIQEAMKCRQASPFVKVWGTALWMLTLFPDSTGTRTCLHGKSLASFLTERGYFECSAVIELCNGTVFNFYLGLPHIQYTIQQNIYSLEWFKHCSYTDLTNTSDTTGTSQQQRWHYNTTVVDITNTNTCNIDTWFLTVSIWYFSSCEWHGTFGSRRKKTVTWVRIKNHLPESLPTVAAVSPN